jgi:hypothetical protein
MARGTLAARTTIGDRGTVQAFDLRFRSEDLAAEKASCATSSIDDRELAPIALGRAGEDSLHGRRSARAPCQEVERKWSEARIGNVLGQDGTDASARMRTARAKHD